MPQAAQPTATYDAVVVGAGFSGMYMLHRLRQLGLSVRVYEAGSGVGGTWYWNRYPGARVDIVSQEYSYSFSPELEDEWQWSEKYAPQAELLAYANHVADRFDLRRDVQFDTRVVSQTFDEAAGRWTVTTDKGDVVSARYCIMATGCLSVPKDIDIPGADTFKGEVYRTSSWPEGLDLSGKRVAVIGTGSSAIQAIPLIAQQAKQLTVYQRTPNFSLPAHNAPADPAVVADWKANRAERRAAGRAQGFGQLFIDENEKNAADYTPEERRAIMEDRWAKGGFALGGSFADLVFDKAANDEVSEFVREKIRGIVKDPATAERLSPRNHPLFTKRPCVDSGYFDTYNRDNVTLVDITATPIQAITPTGIRTADGGEQAFDVIVLAIGFDAMTGALNAIDIKGRGGQTLKAKWADGPKTYLGLMVSGFPNMFLITGPGSPSVLSNMMVSIEQHVDWINDCLAYMANRQLGRIEATEAAETEWVAHVTEVGDTTLYPLANSWYMGSNIPGKPRVFMPYIGGVPVYKEKCDDVAAKGYDGCALSAAGAG